MSTRRWPWIVWAATLAVVVVGLAWQVAYSEGRMDCLEEADDLLILCSGPLYSWVLPLTVGIGLVLIGSGAWAILARAR